MPEWMAWIAVAGGLLYLIGMGFVGVTLWVIWPELFGYKR